MRAKEFLSEAEQQLHPWLDDTLNGALTFPNMDQYYDLYRFSVLIASADAQGNLANPTHVLRDHPMTIGYSKEDQEMITNTAKKLGKKTKKLTGYGSIDPKDTNTQSPVAQRKELKDLYK